MHNTKTHTVILKKKLSKCKDIFKVQFKYGYLLGYTGGVPSLIRLVENIITD